MSVTQFSSADFGKTLDKLKAQKHKKLIHKGVEKGGVDNTFSDERKHPVFIVDLPSNSISLTIGGLLSGGQSNKHRHTYETVVYILDGQGYSVIEGQRVDWEVGDALYIPNWSWHHHVNTDLENPAKYLACENAPMLQNLGQLAIREEV